jgi:hypothetical protein
VILTQLKDIYLLFGLGRFLKYVYRLFAKKIYLQRA